MEDRGVICYVLCAFKVIYIYNVYIYAFYLLKEERIKLRCVKTVLDAWNYRERRRQRDFLLTTKDYGA